MRHSHGASVITHVALVFATFNAYGTATLLIFGMRVRAQPGSICNYACACLESVACQTVYANGIATLRLFGNKYAPRLCLGHYCIDAGIM